jgi:uncharacterized protein (TIGR03437 family)
LAFDSSGNLYLNDLGAPQRLTTNGILSNVDLGQGQLGLTGPAGLVVDSANNVYVAYAVSGKVVKASANGVEIIAGGGNSYTGDGGPASLANVNSPEALAVDAQGNLYFTAVNQLNTSQEIPLQVVRKLISAPSSSGCKYSTDASNQTVSAGGVSTTVGVLASGSTCPWLAISYADWITITAGASGSGTGLVAFTVSSNGTSTSRFGSLSVAGVMFYVTQSGVTCSSAVTPRSVAVPPNGLTAGSIAVASNASDCRWTATASAPWILVSGGSTGTGSGTVTFTVGVNTGGLRTGTITAAGQKVYVNQAAAGASVSTLASINTSGIVNAASFSPPISSGGFVTIYGQNLADTTTDWSSAITNGRLPTSLGGVQVMIDGKNGFIYYVSPTQVNAVAQPDAATGPVEVDVTTNHGTVPANVSMVPVSPGLFAYTLQGTIYADAIFSSDGAYVAAVGAVPGAISRPAQAGDYIMLFATGLGSTNPPYPVGQVLTTAYPVPDLSQISVLIGGRPATVLYAGVTYPGLFQINIQVPSGISAGDQPIVLSVGGQASQSAMYLTCGGSN